MGCPTASAAQQAYIRAACTAPQLHAMPAKGGWQGKHPRPPQCACGLEVLCYGRHAHTWMKGSRLGVHSCHTSWSTCGAGLHRAAQIRLHLRAIWLSSKPWQAGGAGMHPWIADACILGSPTACARWPQLEQPPHRQLVSPPAAALGRRSACAAACAPPPADAERGQAAAAGRISVDANPVSMAPGAATAQPEGPCNAKLVRSSAS